MFSPGELSAGQAAALTELWRQYQRYGMRVRVSGSPLTVAELGRLSGQMIGIDPEAFRGSRGDRLIDACLEVDGYGVPTGELRLTFVDADGNTSCVVKAPCAGAGCDSVWYCTPAGPVETAVGDPKPSGAFGDPYRTEAEALAECQYPPLICSGCSTSYEFPQDGFYLNFTNIVGTPAPPNSLFIARVATGECSSPEPDICYRGTDDATGAIWEMNVVCSGSDAVCDLLPTNMTGGMNINTVESGWSDASGRVRKTTTCGSQFSFSQDVANVTLGVGGGGSPTYNCTCDLSISPA